MPKFQLAKLVRDKIIEKQLQSGETPMYRRLPPDEHKRELVRKIAEEAAEIIDASTDEVAMEIADVQQALDDLRMLYGMSPEAIMHAQQLKNDKNGSFSQGYFIDSVELPDDDQWAAYYRQDPDRFPELTD